MNKLTQNNKFSFMGKSHRRSRGLTMLELLLVVGIMGVFAASSAPYVMRTVGWMGQSLEMEQDYYRLYEASLLISRFVASGGRLNNLVHSNKELKSGSSVLVKNVTNWRYSHLVNDVYRCDLTVEGAGGEQSIRFVVSGFE